MLIFHYDESSICLYSCSHIVIIGFILIVDDTEQYHITRNLNRWKNVPPSGNISHKINYSKCSKWQPEILN